MGRYGNRTTITDPRGNTRSFAFDPFGNQLARTFPDGSTERFFYDDLGRQERHVDFEGRSHVSSYDDLGRMTQRIDIAADGSNQDITTFAYDAFGRQVEVVQDRDGDLTTTADQDVTTNVFDDRGQLVEVDTPQGTLHYAYDDLGRQTAVFTDQSRIEYDHDVLGRLKTVTQVERFGETLPAPEVTTYSYTDIGALESVTLPNGVIAEYTYDRVNRPLSVTHTNADGVVLSNFEYTYDAVGNRLTAEETFDTDADGTADQTNAFT